MNEPQLLALDFGTQSVRAIVFDLRGALLARARVEFEPYQSPQPGWAEVDAEGCWQSLARACRQLWSLPGVRKEAIAGVALTTQRGTVVPVDAEGRALRPAILWLDQRRARGLPPLHGAWGWLFRLAGLSGTADYLRAEAESQWLRTQEPEVWRATHKYLLLSGYLTHRLTSRFVDSVGCQVGYIPFEYAAQRWASPRSWRWTALGLPREWMPELVPPGGRLGEVTPAAAEATGLPAGLPVIAAAADKACEVLGSGCLQSHLGALSYGTTATVNVTHGRYLEPVRLLPAYPSAVPGAFSLEVQVYRGYWMVSWFKREFAERERREAEARGVSPEVVLEEEIAKVPPGSMGLMLQPYWSPGIVQPEAKGAVVGFGDVHTRAHLYRAILEGVAYALREGAERIEGKTGQRITELRVSGGGAQSDAALQISADVFGRPAARPHTTETSALGAAIDLAVGLGLQRDVPTAVREMTRVGQVFEPRREAQQVYDGLYRRVYKKLYTRLKPLYQEIGRVTGYPDLS